MLTKLAVDKLNQHLTPTAVQLAHFSNVRGVVTLADKLRQRGLNQQMPATIEVVMDLL